MHLSVICYVLIFGLTMNCAVDKTKRPKATLFAVLPQRVKSYTWAHINITPSLPNTHTLAQQDLL